MSRKSTVIIEGAYCKGCGICMHFCPKHILEAAPELNSLGYHPPMVVNGGQCSGCRQCEFYCPDFAIFVIAEKHGG